MLSCTCHWPCSLNGLMSGQPCRLPQRKHVLAAVQSIESAAQGNFVHKTGKVKCTIVGAPAGTSRAIVHRFTAQQHDAPTHSLAQNRCVSHLPSRHHKELLSIAAFQHFVKRTEARALPLIAFKQSPVPSLPIPSPAHKEGPSFRIDAAMPGQATDLSMSRAQSMVLNADDDPHNLPASTNATPLSRGESTPATAPSSLIGKVVLRPELRQQLQLDLKAVLKLQQPADQVTSSAGQSHERVAPPVPFRSRLRKPSVLTVHMDDNSMLASVPQPRKADVRDDRTVRPLKMPGQSRAQSRMGLKQAHKTSIPMADRQWQSNVAFVPGHHLRTPGSGCSDRALPCQREAAACSTPSHCTRNLMVCNQSSPGIAEQACGADSASIGHAAGPNYGINAAIWQRSSVESPCTPAQVLVDKQRVLAEEVLILHEREGMADHLPKPVRPDPLRLLGKQKANLGQPARIDPPPRSRAKRWLKKVVHKTSTAAQTNQVYMQQSKFKEPRDRLCPSKNAAQSCVRTPAPLKYLNSSAFIHRTGTAGPAFSRRSAAGTSHAVPLRHQSAYSGAAASVQLNRMPCPTTVPGGHCTGAKPCKEGQACSQLPAHHNNLHVSKLTTCHAIKAQPTSMHQRRCAKPDMMHAMPFPNNAASRFVGSHSDMSTIQELRVRLATLQEQHAQFSQVVQTLICPSPCGCCVCFAFSFAFFFQYFLIYVVVAQLGTHGGMYCLMQRVKRQPSICESITGSHRDPTGDKRLNKPQPTNSTCHSRLQQSIEGAAAEPSMPLRPMLHASPTKKSWAKPVPVTAIQCSTHVRLGTPTISTSKTCAKPAAAQAPASTSHARIMASQNKHHTDGCEATAETGWSPRRAHVRANLWAGMHADKVQQAVAIYTGKAQSIPLSRLRHGTSASSLDPGHDIVHDIGRPSSQFRHLQAERLASPVTVHSPAGSSLRGVRHTDAKSPLGTLLSKPQPRRTSIVPCLRLELLQDQPTLYDPSCPVRQPMLQADHMVKSIPYALHTARALWRSGQRQGNVKILVAPNVQDDAQQPMQSLHLDRPYWASPRDVSEVQRRSAQVKAGISGRSASAFLQTISAAGRRMGFRRRPHSSRHIPEARHDPLRPFGIACYRAMQALECSKVSSLEIEGYTPLLDQEAHFFTNGTFHSQCWHN